MDVSNRHSANKERFRVVVVLVMPGLVERGTEDGSSISAECVAVEIGPKGPPTNASTVFDQHRRRPLGPNIVSRARLSVCPGTTKSGEIFERMAAEELETAAQVTVFARKPRYNTVFNVMCRCRDRTDG